MSILISTVVILIGLIVISNAISVIGSLKVYQNLVLRILGFEKLNIYKLIIFETLILFIPIIISSLIFSIIFLIITCASIFVILAQKYPDVFPNRVDTWVNRFENYGNLDDDASNYQISRAKAAIANGSLVLVQEKVQ